MAVALRLNRYGTKKRPYYRLVACHSKDPQRGRHLEILGTYDPMNISIPKHSTEKQEMGLVNFKTDRIQYWLSLGAQPSATVQSIFKRYKITKPKAA